MQSAGNEPSNSAADPWTYRQILDWTQQKLRDHGSESPRVEAEVLLAHAARCQRIMLYTRLDEATPDDVRTVMRGLVQRRMKSEPVAYLVGHREFFGLSFDVTPAVLVPRPETETLVMAALDWLERHPGRNSVLEVGVGSGCIVTSLAKQRTDLQVVGVDISPEALEVASHNVAKHGVSSRVELRHGATFAATENEQFDLIVSNPPYIRTDEMPGLDADIRNHEPTIALEAGIDGLDVVRQLIANGPRHLKPGGRLLIEVDPAQISPIDEILCRERWTEILVMKDANRADRVIGATRPDSG